MDEVTRILIFTTIFTLSAAILLVMSLTISRRRNLQHKKQLLEKEYKTREEALLQISRDLHDDIGSSLSGINMLSQLAKEQIKLPGTGNTSELLEKINTYTGEVIEKVGDMAWLLKPNSESLSILIKKLKAYGLSVASSKNMLMHFNSSPGISNIETDIRQRKAIYLISKEAINNAVKYSACKNLYCTINLPENGKKKIHLTIKDDGNGFEDTNTVKGNGLINMKARADEINAEIKINSMPGKGTVIELEL